MAYIIDLAESLHLTQYQRKQVLRILQQRATSNVLTYEPTRQHRTASKFHGQIIARFADVDAAKHALKEIGKLMLGGWDESYTVYNEETGETILLLEREIAEINAPQSAEEFTGGQSVSGDWKSPDLWRRLMVRQNYQCYVCGLSWKKQASFYQQSFDIHRILPGHAGGKYTDENTIMVCHDCHVRVQGMNMDETNQVRDSLNNHRSK